MKVALVTTVLLVACGHGLAETKDLQSPLAYQNSTAWLCLPDRAGDACDVALTSTVLHHGGTGEIVTASVAKDPKIDCFYVYPTVDWQLVPGNHAEFPDKRISEVAVAQAAHFRQICKLYVPYYRQITLGTYGRSKERIESGLALAFADVEAAFAQYLTAFNHDRKIAIIGHSQGSEMVIRLLKKFFDQDEHMRERLVIGMPIGGNVQVPQGKRAGATFTNLPLCAASDDVGCIIAYRTHAAGSTIKPGRWAPDPGNVAACVNPAGEGDADEHVLSGAIFPLTDTTKRRLHGTEGMTTPFLQMRDFYGAKCADGPNGYRYLSITTVDGTAGPIDFEHDLPQSGWMAELGLHLLDFQLPQADLVEAIAHRIK